jgi:hypothetical protein
MADAYRGEPTADRITVALREPGRTAQQGTIVVKIAHENPPPAHTPAPTSTQPEAPGINKHGVEPPAQPAEPAEVPAPVLIAAVELGQFRLYIHGRELTAAMTSNPTCYFQTTLTPPPTPDGEPAPTETVEPLLAALARVIGPVPALPLALAGQISLPDPAAADCTLLADGAAARCAVGKGQVTVIADAAVFEHDELAGDGGAILRQVVSAALP